MPDHSLNRRQMFIAMAALASAGGMTALPGMAHAAKPLEGKSLRFGTWGGSWRDTLDQLAGASLRDQGVDLQYVLGNPSDNLARLIAARGRDLPIDTMQADVQTYNSLIAGKFLQRIDAGHLPNAALLPAFARSEYSVATGSIVSGIVYNTDKFAAAGIKPPERYSDLADPKLAGHVSFFDNNGEPDHYHPIAGLAYEAGGNEFTPERALPMVKKINPNFHTSSTEAATKFASGEIWAAPWQAGYVIRLRRANVPTEIVYPHFGSKVGSLVSTQHCILAGTKNTDAAEALLDLCLSPDVQYQFSKFAGNVPLNEEARKRRAEDADAKGVLMLATADIDNTLQIDFSKIDMVKWRDQWQREMK